MVRCLGAALAATAIVGSLTASPAYALLNRAWVSGKGADSASCGPVQTPCRTLQYVHDSIIAAGGEINFVDSAGYGALTITKSLNVVNAGNIAGVLAAAGGNAITVNAGATDSVLLQGLVVEGSNAGYNGAFFVKAGKLVISDCLFQGFVGSGGNGNGIAIAPVTGTPTVVVTNSQAVNNSNAGLFVVTNAATSLNLSVTQSVFGNNNVGINASVGVGTSSALNQFTIADTLAVNNAGNGMTFASYDTKLVLALDTARITGNGGDGLATSLSSSSALFLARSAIAGNTGYGVNNSGGSSSTFSDNRINQNVGGDVKNALTGIPGK